MTAPTVEPLNKDTFGTSSFILCREVVLLEVIFYGVCIQEYFGLSFVGGLECPLLEVSLSTQCLTLPNTA